MAVERADEARRDPVSGPRLREQGAALAAAQDARADHEVRLSARDRREQQRELLGMVAVVTVQEDEHVGGTARDLRDARETSAAVAAPRPESDARRAPPADLGRPVGRSVVDDDDLGDRVARKVVEDPREAALLVENGDDDAHAHLVAPRAQAIFLRMDATKSPPRTGASSLTGGREPADGANARSRSAAGQLVGLVRSMRPHQWTKNVFVFAALIFAQRFDRSEDVLRTTAAFALFCALSGAVYIINDLVDREKDRAHARKRLRPIASGRVAPASAAVFATILVVASLGLAFALATCFGVVAAAYFVVNLLYSFYLIRLVILDVMTIAFGFVLRAVAGAEVIHVPISPWLILCTSLLALFLGFCKRRHELTYLQAGASGHRESLREYHVALLARRIAVVTASTVIVYALYAMSPEVQEKLHTNYLGVTVPFVLYGIFRYLYVLNMKGEGGSPSQVLLEDKPLLLNVILWMATCVVLLYFRL